MNLKLTHGGLMTPYGDMELGQHWLRWWLVAWRHQAITWTNVDLSSVRSSDIHLRASSQEITQPSVPEIIWNIKYLKFHLNFPGANELIKNIHFYLRSNNIGSAPTTKRKAWLAMTWHVRTYPTSAWVSATRLSSKSYPLSSRRTTQCQCKMIIHDVDRLCNVS